MNDNNQLLEIANELADCLREVAWLYGFEKPNDAEKALAKFDAFINPKSALKYE